MMNQAIDGAQTRPSASEDRTRLLMTAELFWAPILKAPEEPPPSFSAPESLLWRFRVTMFLYLSSFWMASCSDLTFSLPEAAAADINLLAMWHIASTSSSGGSTSGLARIAI